LPAAAAVGMLSKAKAKAGEAKAAAKAQAGKARRASIEGGLGVEISFLEQGKEVNAEIAPRNIVKSGWLFKAGGVDGKKGKKKRFFTVGDFALAYYDKELSEAKGGAGGESAQKHLKGTMDLADVTEVGPSDAEPFEFNLVTAEGRLLRVFGETDVSDPAAQTTLAQCDGRAASLHGARVDAAGPEGVASGDRIVHAVHDQPCGQHGALVSRGRTAEAEAPGAVVRPGVHCALLSLPPASTPPPHPPHHKPCPAPGEGERPMRACVRVRAGGGHGGGGGGAGRRAGRVSAEASLDRWQRGVR
jgi:hypothetical protein